MNTTGEQPREMHPLMKILIDEAMKVMGPVLEEISKAWEEITDTLNSLAEGAGKKLPPTHVGPLVKPRPPKNTMRAGYAIAPRRHGQRHREHQYKRPTRMRL